jgi:hypothetical protein
MSFWEWLKTYDYLALWIGGIALLCIFIWERIDSYRHGRETREQLDTLQEQAKAATSAAVAAKQSADLTTSLHRPYMGLSAVSSGGRDNRYWNITFSLMNFGTLPAYNVGLVVEGFVDETSRSQHQESTTVQMFPNDTMQVTYLFDWGDIDGPLIRQESKKLRLHISIPYQFENGRKFEYKAEVAYHLDRFAVEKSTTTEL